MKKWETRSSDSVFKNEVFSLVRNECHHPVLQVDHEFYTLQTKDWINVIARTESGEFILVRQHRLGNGEITIETPGGLIEPHESPAECARRELLEETGYLCESPLLIKKLTVNPAILNNDIYIYYAPYCKKAGGQSLDIAEDIEILLLKERAVRDMMESGEISHSIVYMALILYFNSPYAQ